MEVSEEDEEMPEKRIFLSKLENTGEEMNEEKLAMYTTALKALQSVIFNHLKK